MSPPLVSCIMPTFDRRPFVPLAIEYFLRQDYEAKELVILDDGRDPVGDLVPDDPRVRYHRLDSRLALGAKRNAACEEAAGDVIVHWDDDDWSAPWRLSYQVGTLLDEGAEVCGLRNLLFYEPRSDRGYRYTYPTTSTRPWVAGGTLCYTRDFWSGHRFADVRQGEDTRFLWSGRPRRLVALEDERFYVAMIHRANTARKSTSSRRWARLAGTEVRELLGPDAANYDVPVVAAAAAPAPPGPAPAPTPPVSRSRHRPVRNVFACLVHEEPMVVWDLVRNLTHLDPESTVLLYDGGPDPTLLDRVPSLDRLGVHRHPSPSRMEWGELHGFALDAMAYALENLEFDTLTIVDSDQLALRAGYSAYLGDFLAGQENVGMLGKEPARLPRTTREGPARTAWREHSLWQPLLGRLPGGDTAFPHWTFWPSTVFTRQAAAGLVDLFATDDELKEIVAKSRIWATEEVILPTLVAALGHRVVANPCTYDVVKYRVRYTPQLLDRAMREPSAYWAHPIPRSYDHPLRRHVRARHGGYGGDGGPAELDPTPLLSVDALLARMRRIEGWLEPEEADLLLGAALAAFRDFPGGTHRVVELGSYCGRATVVLAGAAAAMAPGSRVVAVDSHDGRVGAAGQRITSTGSTHARFTRNVAAAGLTEAVQPIVAAPHEVDWSEPISLLLVDGLHDYDSVARDFNHYAPHVVPGGFVAFHDYADYWPGVMALADEVMAAGGYRRVAQAGSLLLLRKR